MIVYDINLVMITPIVNGIYKSNGQFKSISYEWLNEDALIYAHSKFDDLGMESIYENNIEYVVFFDHLAESDGANKNKSFPHLYGYVVVIRKHSDNILLLIEEIENPQKMTLIEY
jgi:hypothetical protein